jgi:hypothetical protein
MDRRFIQNDRYSLEEYCAVRDLVEATLVVLEHMKSRRWHLTEDLIALEREQDDRAQSRRRENRKRLERLRKVTV